MHVVPFRVPSLAVLLAATLPLGAQPASVGALGKVVPRGGITHLSCLPGDLIESIGVRLGDRVPKGKVLATLKVDPKAQLAFEAARAGVREAKELGPKVVELQRLRTKGAQQDFDHAQRRFQRFKEGSGEAISTQHLDELEHQMQAAALALEMATLELARVTGEQGYRLARAENELKVAEHTLQRFVLKAPFDGTILEICRSAGDRTDAMPVLRMANLQELLVVADVFEGDLKKLRVGMRATITSKAFASELSGKVLAIGTLVDKEAKTAHVQVLLDAPQGASRFINMETSIVIHLQ